MVRLSDAAIRALVVERKSLPPDYQKALQTRDKKTGKQATLEVVGEDGHDFRVILRQSHINPLDFSAILIHTPANSNNDFRLRRYNGKTGEHTNSIERTSFDGFHIHYATERYQERGEKEDTYAEPTDRYATLADALQCLLDDCGFVRPPEEQLSLFAEEA